MAKILFFGDVMGRPGREGLRLVLPKLREEFAPDVVITNVENLAHGKGVTLTTMQDLADLNVDVFTSGNHVFDKGEMSTQCFERYENLIRPHNYGAGYPGVGYVRIEKNGQHYLIINLNGKVFFENQFKGPIENPFFALDQIIMEQSQKDDIIFVDVHAEATSEKVAMGWYADGRVTALVGTHTHVPTADFRILPKGTAYITDAGMTGPRDSVIGAKIENSLTTFLDRGKFVLEVADTPTIQINGVLIETVGSKAVKIERVYREVVI